MNLNCIETLIKLELLRTLGGRRKWLFLLLSLLPIGLIVLVQIGTGESPLLHNRRRIWDWAVLIYLLYPQILCLLLSLLLGSSLLQAEIDDKTIIYLFTRPIPKYLIFLGKYIGSVIMSITFSGASFVICYFISVSTSLPGINHFNYIISYIVAIALSCICYTSIFFVLGTFLPKYALIAGIVYGVIFELILSFIPAIINKMSISYYLRSFLRSAIEIKVPQEVVSVVGELNPLSSVMILIAIAIVLLSVGILLVTVREYNVTEEV